MTKVSKVTTLKPVDCEIIWTLVFGWNLRFFIQWNKNTIKALNQRFIYDLTAKKLLAFLAFSVLSRNLPCNTVVSRFFFFLLHGCCEDTLPPLSYLDYQSDEKRISLRDRDRLGNYSQWVPGFLSCCSWMFPGTASEQVRTCGFRRIS